MTVFYVRSAAAGANNGTSWANAWTTWSTHTLSAGDIMAVSEETNGAGTTGLTPTFGTIKVNRPLVLCVDRTGSTPPVSADLRTTGSNGGSSGSNTTIKGCAVVYGLTINAGAAGGSGSLQLCNNNADYQTYDNCTLKVLRTSGSDKIEIGLAASIKGGICEWLTVTTNFAASGQSIALGSCDLIWKGGSHAGTAPTTLFTDLGSTSTAQVDVLVEAVDLSGITGTLVGDIAVPVKVRFLNCKLGSGVTALATQTQDVGATVFIQNSDSGSTNYRNEKHNRRGSQTTETTIVMSGGTSDGTTSYSDKIVTSANCDVTVPFEVMTYALWNDTTGSAKTITVEMVTDNVTLKNNEIWATLDTLQTSGFPTGTLATSKPDWLSAGSNVTTSSVTWTTTGLTTPVKQKISFTFTPQKKGLVLLTVYVGKASTTVYVSGPTALT